MQHFWVISEQFKHVSLDHGVERFLCFGNWHWAIKSNHIESVCWLRRMTSYRIEFFDHGPSIQSIAINLTIRQTRNRLGNGADGVEVPAT